MRRSAAASILVIGLVAAACGGDEATPEPTDEATAAPVATEVAEQPVEEPTGAPADEEPAEEETADEPDEEVTAAEPEFGTKAALSNEDDPTTEFSLTSGRYRLQWSTDDCEAIDMLIQQVDGDFEYSKPSTASFASASISDMPEGVYTIEQLNESCATWSMRLDRMSA